MPDTTTRGTHSRRDWRRDVDRRRGPTRGGRPNAERNEEGVLSPEVPEGRRRREGVEEEELDDEDGVVRHTRCLAVAENRRKLFNRGILIALRGAG